MMYKVIICGSRNFQDYAFLKLALDELRVKWGSYVEVVSGHAKGADQLGERWAARERGI